MIEAVERATDSAHADALPIGSLITEATVAGRGFRFITDTGKDIVQRHLREGRFYEQDELDLLARYFPKGGVFVDIGANVGNHTLYAAAFFGARRVVSLEPNHGRSACFAPMLRAPGASGQ